MNEEDAQWRIYAACAPVPREVFYVNKGGSLTPAKRICSTCPVRRECLEFAMRAEGGLDYHRHGVFGGLSPSDRSELDRSSWRPGDYPPDITYSEAVCPQCGRYFHNVQTHITLKHKLEAVVA